MVLVVTDSADLAMVYATSLGGIMVEKQSVRRKNLDTHKDLLREKAYRDGFLTTFFRGEQYVFVTIPYGTYMLNRMSDYQADYADLAKRPVPFFPDSFAYRCCDERISAYHDRISRFCQDATSIVNATSDSMSGTLAFLHFQKEFSLNKMITRVRPNILSEEKILEAFNAREDWTDFRDFSEACLLFERLNWLVNCNVSNAVMQATKGKVPMAAGRIEAVLLKVIQQATDSEFGFRYVRVKDKRTGRTITCTLSAHSSSPGIGTLKKGTKLKAIKVEGGQHHVRHICNCFSVLLRSGSQYDISLAEATEALWRLFINGYITWPSTSEAMPWSLKPALTAAISQLAKQPRFNKVVSPGDIERFADWDNEDTAFGRTAMIVTAKDPAGLSGIERIVYDLVGEGIAQEFGRDSGYVIPTFRSEDIQIVAREEVPQAVLQAGDWRVDAVSTPGDGPYMWYYLLRDVLPFFTSALYEDFRYFLTPLSNITTWRMAEEMEDGGFRITAKGQLLLQYISSTPLVDPVATTFWDCRLLRVANGVVSAQSVLADVTPYINDLAAYIKVVVDTMEATGGIVPSDCVCPKCRSALVWDEKLEGWSCSGTEQGCTFFLPGKFKGHTLSVRDMALLLTQGTSELSFDFVSSKGGTFPARLVFDDSYHLEFSFQSKCLCPRCKGKYMNEFQWGLACPDKNCGYSANTLKREVRLTETDEIAIFSGGKTRWIDEFISAQGKAFKARLYLSSDLKIKFEFPEK